MTPLINASSSGHVEVASVLLQSGGNAEAKDEVSILRCHAALVNAGS